MFIKYIFYGGAVAVIFYSTMVLPKSPHHFENAVIWNYLIAGKDNSSGEIVLIDLFDSIVNAKINRYDIRTHIKSFDDLLKDVKVNNYTFNIDPTTFQDGRWNGGVKMKVKTTGDISHYTLITSTEDGPICYYYYDVINGTPSNLRFGIITRMNLYLAIIGSFIAITVMYLLIKLALLIIKYVSHYHVN